MRLALRTLLSAGFLLGMLAPLASGQWEWPQMYEYRDLERNGSVVYGYVETDLLQPTTECLNNFGDFCWLSYSSFAEANLFSPSYSQSSAEDEHDNTYASAWIQADVEVGTWQLQSIHELQDIWFALYEEWPQYYDPSIYDDPWATPLNINPEISISNSQYIDDGGAGYFNVTVEAGEPTLYSWSYDYAPGSGNYPNVDFSDPWSSSTLTDGHWYASPDDACSAGRQAQYSITATVEFDHPLLSLYDTTSLNVVLPVIGGATYPPWLMPYISTAPVNGLWRVLPESYFVKHDPPVLNAFTSQSQFYEKVVAHEDVHVDQYMPGGLYHLDEDLYSATAARNVIIGLTDATAERLDNKIEQAFQEWWASQTNLDTQRLVQAEAEGYAASDGIAPQYVYQGQCGGL